MKKSKDLEDEVHEKTQEIDNLKETLDRRNISSQSTASSLADELDKDQPKCNSFDNKSQCMEGLESHMKNIVHTENVITKALETRLGDIETNIYQQKFTN